jgi:LasA protease
MLFIGLWIMPNVNQRNRFRINPIAAAGERGIGRVSNGFSSRSKSGLRILLRAALLGIGLFGLTACGEAPQSGNLTPDVSQETPTISLSNPTPLPTRVTLEPGQIVDYAVQSGDTLEAVAAHFNTSVEEIRQANPDLPLKVTTLTPGAVLHVPAYFAPFTGTPFQMIPDSEVVASPSVKNFSVQDYIQASPGYLKSYSEYAYQSTLTASEIVDRVARDFSVRPRLLLALLEYRSYALSRSDQSDGLKAFPLGTTDSSDTGLTLQLSWAAAELNEGYYGWRTGSLREMELADGRVARPDPWQNAGTVAVQYLLSHWFGEAEFKEAISPDGFIRTYWQLFGDPFSYSVELMPGDLRQPEMQLPFEPEKVWTFTGGPHPAWGDNLPWAALDFAPPSSKHGCQDSAEWVTAVSAGVVARSGQATVILDLDGDGDENTGWTILYFHIATLDRVEPGARLKPGDHIGHPSCEGGRANGTNVHMARRYNGEWISAAGPLAFNLSGWVAGEGEKAYDGTLSYYLDKVLVASDIVQSNNRIWLPGPEDTTPTPE